MPGGIHPPLAVMLGWPRPNFENPETRPKTVLVTACIFGSVTLMLLVARLWVRIRIQHSSGWDDWLMLAAVFPTIALTIIFPLVTEAYGFNKHVWDVEPRLFPTQRKFVLVIEVVFCIASGLIKISILLFYRRLSDRAVSPTFRWATWISIGFIASHSISFSIVPIFLCNPISAFWEQSDLVKIASGYEYKCLNEGADVFAAGVISAVQDLITATLPTIVYWKLRIPLRQKLGLFCIFGLGYGVVALAGLRAYASWEIFFATYDVTWVAMDNWLWSMLELHIGAMCANAPALKVFFGHFFQLDKLTKRSKSRSTSSGRHTGSKSHTQSSTSSSSIFSRLGWWKRYGEQNSTGYLSELHTDLSVDTHGCVRKGAKTDARPHEPEQFSSPLANDSIVNLTGRHYMDIEMGSIGSATTGEEDIQALPPYRPNHTTPFEDLA